MKKLTPANLIKSIIVIYCCLFMLWVGASILNIGAHNIGSVEEVAAWNFFNFIM